MRDDVFLDLLDLCYKAVDVPEAWHQLVGNAATIFGADAADLCVENYSAGVAHAVGTVGFETEYRESYDADFLGGNPWIERLKLWPYGRTAANHAEPEDFERSVYYNEWVKPQGLRHAMGAILESNPTRLIHIGFLRNRDRGGFTQEDAKGLDRVLPHILRSVSICERLDLASSRQSSLLQLIEAFALPAFLFDSHGRVFYANPPAEALCRDGSELTIRFGRLRASNPHANSSLKAAIAKQCCLDNHADDPLRGSLFIERTDSSCMPLVLEIIPLRSDRVVGVAEPRCLLLVNDPARPLPARLEFLQQLWKFTFSEAQLALALANSESVSEYADRAGVAVSTARWHLKNIQSKTDTHNAKALVALIRASLLPV
jgi:DNA-binding CsgD family transcriptional regulator